MPEDIDWLEQASIPEVLAWLDESLDNTEMPDRIRKKGRNAIDTLVKIFMKY